MKKLGRVLLYIFLSFLGIVIILVIIAGLAQDKIVKLALEQVSETTSVPMEVEEINFSLIHSFPLATLECRNLLVSSPDTVQNPASAKEPLINVGRLYVSVKAMPLLKGIFEIKKVELDDTDLFYKVDSLGKTNYDFLLDTTQQEAIDTSSNSIYLDVKTLKLENIRWHYRDQQMKTGALLVLNELDLSGQIDNDEYFGEVEGEAQVSGCYVPETQLDQMEKAKFAFKLNYKDRKIDINQLEVEIDDNARFAVEGNLALDGCMEANLKVKGDRLNLAGLTNYIPGKYFTDYNISKLDGRLDVDATVSGCLNDSLRLPHIEARAELTNGSVQYADYPQVNRIVLIANATNGAANTNETTSVNIDSLSFTAANSNVGLKGIIQNLDQISYSLNTIVDLDLNDINPYIEDSLVKTMNGRIRADLSTSGVLPDSVTDAFINSVAANTNVHLRISDVNIELDSTLSVLGLNGQCFYKPGYLQIDSLLARVPEYHLNLRGLNLKTDIAGQFTKPESLDLAIRRFDLATDSSSIHLNGQLKNPMAPDYSFSAKAKLNLAEIYKMLPDSSVGDLRGIVETDLHSAAKLNLDSIGVQMNDVLFSHSNLSVKLTDFNLDMPDSMMCVHGLSGKVEYKNDTVWIDQLKGNYLGLQFGSDSTTISSVYTAAIQNKSKELKVHGKFDVDKFDYGLIEKLMASDSVAEAEPLHPDPYQMNFTYNVNGTFHANQLKYGENLFNNVDTKFLVKDSYYVLDSMRMEAYDGNALSSAKIEMKPGGEMDVFFKTKVERMDVSQIIDGFQEYITMDDFTSENAKGMISTNMDGKIVLDGNFEPVYNSLMLKGDLEIENGALINVKPVMEVEKIPGVGLKNMDKLYFSTLKSSVFLFKNELYIPKTEIRSTSFDAMFLGMSSFGEDYAYHIRMFLGEVLSSKSKANLKKQAKDAGFGEDKDDVAKGRTSIYLVSKKEGNKEKAWFDNKKDRANMVAKVNVREQLLNFNFHPLLVKYNTEQ